MRRGFRGWLVLAMLLVSVLLPLAAMSGSNEELVFDQWRAGGRADCPTTQNDAGVSGDAGDTISTARSFGDDPQFTGKTGCLDDYDYYDYYTFNMTSNGMDIEFELTVPTPLSDNDFNIYLEDANGNLLDESFESSPGGGIEHVSSVGTSGSGTAGTYYFVVSQMSGNGTYSIDAWINSSQPHPDLTPSWIVSDVNSSNVGDTVNLSYSVTNVGSLDMTSTYDIFFVLSDPFDVWNYYMILDSNGNEFSAQGSALLVNQSEQITTEITLSNNIANGTFLWSVRLDTYNNVTETSTGNNDGYGSLHFNVGAVVNCSSLGADAGTGIDAGDQSSTAIDLGPSFNGTVTGCFSSGDSIDYYSVEVFDGQNLSIVLDGQTGADNDLYLYDSLENSVNMSTNLDDMSENVSTIGTSWAGTANTYFIKVTKFTGSGTYTLHIVSNGSTAPERVCGWDTQDDLGLGADAGSIGNSALSLGTNPTITGMGCLDDLDQIDAYSFDLAGMYGVSIAIDQSTIQDYSLVISDGQGNQLAEVKSAGQSLNYDTSSISIENLVGSYVMDLNANGAQGTYNLSMTLIDPPLPDLAATSVHCPAVSQGESTDITNGSQFSFNLTAESVGGPSDVPFDWQLTLMDENGTQAAMLQNGSHDGILAGVDGVIISESGTFTVADNFALGEYHCTLFIDSSDLVSEAVEPNNVLQAADFSIILRTVDPWEGDNDHDGILNVSDDCPDVYGTSTEDLVGCFDMDGDGWSDDGDAFFNEGSQWLDTDGDGFGDNPSGFNGDQCPSVVGVADGTNGTGCPLIIPDTDADGVSDVDDDCPGTAVGVVVDETGCEPPPEPEPETPPLTNESEGPSIDEGETEPAGDEQESGGFTGLMIGGIVGGILLVIVIVTVFITKDEIGVILGGRRKYSSPATSSPSVTAPVVSTPVVSEPIVQEQPAATVVTPAKQEYEQQLIDQGYSPEQAKTYADHYYN